MRNVKKCLHQIEKVRAVVDGQTPDAARSRVKRLVLETMRLVSASAGLQLPGRPGVLSAPVNAGSQLVRIVAACNQLNGLSRSIAQPSEPLDSRWRVMWCSLVGELDELELALLDWTRAGSRDEKEI